MKIKISGDLCAVVAVVLILFFALSLFGSVGLAFLTKQWEPLLFLAVAIFTAIGIFRIRVDYFGTATISKSGITVKCLRKIFFSAKWEEMFFCEFDVFNKLGPTRYMCLSKTGLKPSPKNHFRGSIPSTYRMKGEAVFIAMSPTVRKKILEYVPEENIKQYGYDYLK